MSVPSFNLRIPMEGWQQDFENLNLIIIEGIPACSYSFQWEYKSEVVLF